MDTNIPGKYAHSQYVGKKLDAGKPKKKYQYIKHIPLEWYRKARHISPMAAVCGVAIWYLVGLRKDKTIILSNKILEKQFGILRRKKRSILEQLEQAGLIEVEFRNKRSPIVTVLDQN